MANVARFRYGEVSSATSPGWDAYALPVTWPFFSQIVTWLLAITLGGFWGGNQIVPRVKLNNNVNVVV